MADFDYFELQRLSDDLVYQFDRRSMQHGQIGYQRRDQDLWITFIDHLGWVAWDEVSESVMGRPWNILPGDQNSDHPPEDVWVSRKENKSYVYKLKYIK